MDLMREMRIPRWERFNLARQIERDNVKLIANFKLLSFSERDQFLWDRRTEFKDVDYFLHVLTDKCTEFLYKIDHRNGRKYPFLRLKAPQDWVSDSVDVINRLWEERFRVEKLIKYLTWIHEVTKCLSLSYIQYCNEIGCEAKE